MKKQTLNEEIYRMKDMMRKLMNEDLYGAAGWENGMGDRETYQEPSNEGPIPKKPTYTEENREAVDFLENFIKNNFQSLKYDAVEPHRGDMWGVSIFKVGDDGFYEDKNFPHVSLGLIVSYDKYTRSVTPISISIDAELEDREIYHVFENNDPNVKYFGYMLTELGRTNLADKIREEMDYTPSDDEFDNGGDFD